MNKPIRLKRYANRRLYNTRDSIYTTLPEVAALIKDGNSIEILDAKTGEDVTACVLTQILVEQARQRNFLLPESLLHMMIRYGDNLLSDFFENYLEYSARNYLVFKSTVDQQFRKWMEMGKLDFFGGLSPGDEKREKK